MEWRRSLGGGAISEASKNALEASPHGDGVATSKEDKRGPPGSSRKRVFSAPAQGRRRSIHKWAPV